MSSKAVGSGLASFGAFIFFYYSIWIFIIPFIDSGHWLHDFFLDKVWAVRIPQALLITGVVGILVLVLITILCSRKVKTS